MQTLQQLALQEPLALQDPKVQRVLQDLQDLWVQQVRIQQYQDQLGLQAQRELMVLMVLLDRLVPQVQQAQLAQQDLQALMV